MARPILGLALMVAVETAAAHAQELPLDIEFSEMVNLPNEAPRLTVRARGEVKGAHLVLREGGRSVLARGLGTLGAGASRDIVWSAKPGVHEYTVEVSGKTAEGGARVSVDATVTVMRPLEIALRRDQVDLEERSLRFTMSNPAGRAELTILGATGQTLHEGTTDLSGRAAGSPLDVRWPELSEAIQRMVLRGYDASDSWAEYELLPFRIDIPHEDVVFETARWDIRDSERPKLDEAHERILEAIREHGADLKARLYILGHTDTVGMPGDNLLLSERRAEVIARYFRDKGGIALPILSRGFGETQPAVKTADNVDEARNRRAQYILAAQAPAPGAWTTVSAGSAPGGK